MKTCMLRLLFVIAIFPNIAYSFDDGLKATEKSVQIGSKRKAKSGENEIIYPVLDGLSLILEPNATGWTIKGVNVDDARARNSEKIDLVVPKDVDGIAITEVGDGAFLNVGAISSIELPESIVAIGKGAFQFCDNLQAVILSKDLKTIGERAFSNCRKLKNVVMDDSVRSIGAAAFGNCSSLESIVLPNSIEKIEQAAFEGCLKLESINIPTSLKEIPPALLGVTSVKEIVIPNSVISICNNSLSCRKLEKVFIGKNVEEIRPFVFSGARNLKEVVVDSDNQFFCVKDSMLMTEDGKRLIRAFGKTKTRCDIPQSIVSIGADAFANEEPSLILIPAGVYEINEYAFNKMEAHIPPLPPKSPLTVVVDKDNPNFKSVKGALLTKDGKRYLQTPLGCEDEYVIPNGVETIAPLAFTRAAFKKITIPGSVKVIERRAFESLANLEEVVIEEGVEEIRENAFPPYAVLRTVVIPKSVERIATVEPNRSEYHSFPEEKLRNPFGSETTLRVPKGSYAEKWAIEQKMKYETID